ncbi:MAG: cobalamin biosynthesis protein, partial [Betaproteobacteria bacterium]
MKIVAHRGYCARFPENSIVAFEQAIGAAADLVETDVRMTRDGIPVCWHDPDLRRVAGVGIVIEQVPAAELAAITLPGGARVCRLSDVLSLARGRVPLMLDVKVDGVAVQAAVIEAV